MRSLMAGRVVLVTGFTAFAEHADNPAALIARDVDGAVFGDTRVVGRTLPVTWDGAFDALEAAVEFAAPAALLMLGVAARPGMWFETLGRNHQGDREDAAGRRPSRPEVEPGGPPARLARLPWSRLSGGPLTVTYSQDAGDYLCNHLLYRSLGAFEHVPLRGFVHVPPLPGSGAPHAEPPERLLAAGRALVARLARVLAPGVE
jgi:pyroglutamyl-peptidase